MSRKLINMSLHFLTAVFGLTSCVLAAALHPAKQAAPSQSPSLPSCLPATIYSYVTVTVTDVPDVVTVAVPNYSSISSSLGSVYTIDSIVVVENSINRPVGNPPDEIVPTYVHTIEVPAVEITEASHIGTSIFYLPGTRPVSTIVIGVTTESIILSPWISPDRPQPTATVQSPARAFSSPDNNFTAPLGGWNGTGANVTGVAPATGSGVAASQNHTATVIQTTYVNTTTNMVDATVTVTPEPGYGFPPPQYSSSDYDSYVKRQTCVLISAKIGGQWASWCNNWDGSKTYSYTSWETTVTPGTSSDMSTTVSPSSSTTSTLTRASTITVAVIGPPTTMTETVVPISSNSDPRSSLNTPAPSSSPSACGETGAFSISFDDLPKQSVFENETAALPPIFSPYRHLFWADGWSYLPPPSDPYAPHNGEQLAIFVPDQQQASTPASPDIGAIPLGGFGAGPRSSSDIYWFNIHSLWVGCDNNATDPTGQCDFVAEGYRYDNQTDTNRLFVSQHFSQPLCATATCQLTQIFFPDTYSQLSSISFYAKIGGTVRTFYVDDIQLSWLNNTCDAGITRSSSRN